MSYVLSPLPYALNALQPYLSQETLEYHYGKHHQAYVNKLNSLIAGTDLAEKSLEELIKTQSGVIFNNAAQIWNHQFYWQCLSPKFNQTPSGKLLEVINKKWGQLDAFKKEFKEKALANFGSGWTWLVKLPNGDLEIINTSNAANPMTEEKKPLLTCDVWEHAYYIDYRNDRGVYVDHFWSIVNWDFVAKNFD